MRGLWMRLLVCGLGIALGAPLWAQTTTGGIAGSVKDASGAALPGVTVTLSGPNIVGSQTAATGATGFYRFIGLPPGQYELTFALAGFKTLSRKGLRVGVGTTTEVNGDLAMSQLAEQIEVVGGASTVDTTSNQVGTNLDRSFVENVSNRRTSFFDLVATAPGSLAAGEGSGDHSASTRTMVYGSSYDDNSFKLDGVEITDNYWGEALAEPNIDAIEEIQVLSLGAPAEYGNLQGAVYNIVTRQGTNDFHGDANFFTQPSGLTSDNLKDTKNPNGASVEACPTSADPNRRCPFNRVKYQDFSVQVGGPVIKDKLWFFGSYQLTRDRFSQAGVDPSSVGRITRDRFMGKLNWQLNPKHKLVASFHMDKGNLDRALAVGEAPTRAYTRAHKTPVPGVSYTGVLSDKTVLDVRYSGFFGSVHGGPTDPNQPKNLTRISNYNTGELLGGAYYFYSLDPYRRQTATAKVSHLADDFLGAGHDFHFGIQYGKGEVLGTYGLNDAVYIYGDYTYGYHRTPWRYSGVGRSVGAFLDDTVRVNSRLTLNLGVRYDRDDASANAVDERTNLATGDGTSTGKVFPGVDWFTWNSVSPRLGFNLKLSSDGKTVVKGHWGQYHKAVATGEFANRMGPSITPAFFGTDYNFATGQFGSLTQTTSPEKASIAAGYSSPHTDQFILSLERDLGREIGVNLNYVHKKGDNFTSWEPIGGVFIPVTYVDSVGTGATNQSIELQRLQNSRSDLRFELDNDPRMLLRVNAVSLGLVKRMSGKWSLNSSLTWQRSTGRLAQSREGVELRQLGGMQFREFGRDPNDFVNTDGRQRGDVEWQFKTQLVYKLPWDLLVSANVSYRDGANLIRQKGVSSLTRLGSTVLLQKRGTTGRLPSVTFVDARLAKDFKLAKDVRLGFSVDAFNLLNDDAPQRVRSSRVDSSVFNWPRDFVLPRRLLVGAKLKF